VGEVREAYPEREVGGDRDREGEQQRDHDGDAEARHLRADGEAKGDREERDEEQEEEGDEDLGRGHAAEEEGQRADRGEHDDVHADRGVRGQELPARDLAGREAREDDGLPGATLALGGDAVRGDGGADHGDDEVGEREEDLKDDDAGGGGVRGGRDDAADGRDEERRRDGDDHQDDGRALEAGGLAELADPEGVRLGAPAVDAVFGAVDEALGGGPLGEMAPVWTLIAFLRG
jgi:hypothetical protein